MMNEGTYTKETYKIKGLDKKTSLGILFIQLSLFTILFTFFDSFFRYISLSIVSFESVASSTVSGALLSLVLGFIFSRLPYKRFTRIGIAWFSLFIIQSLNNLIEAVYFTTAIPTVTIFAAALIFGLITSLPEAILAGILFSPENTESSFNVDLRKFFSKKPVSLWLGRIALGSFVYFPIYYFFGTIISPWIIAFYNNPSQVFGLTIPTIEVIIQLQFLRGFLYVLAIIPIIVSLKVPLGSMFLSVAGLLFIAGAFVPFIAYSELSIFLRIAHGLEILADSIVYGASLVYIMRIREEAQAVKYNYLMNCVGSECGVE